MSSRGAPEKGGGPSSATARRERATIHGMRAPGTVLAASAALVAVLVACGSDPDTSAAASDAGTAAEVLDGAAPSSDGGASSDGGVQADAATIPIKDDPFACASGQIPGPDPSYAVAGALPAFTGGAIQPGLYRAVKGTHLYVEAAPGDCSGVTPPAVTPFKTELELRPTQYALRILTTAVAGTWTTSGNALKLTQACPDAKPESGVPYTATGETILFRATKQDHLSGGCHFYMVYELARQP